MLHTDGDPAQSAKAAARAHGVPSWVADTTPPSALIFGCAWLSCSERFATAQEAEQHIAAHDKLLSNAGASVFAAHEEF